MSISQTPASLLPLPPVPALLLSVASILHGGPESRRRSGLAHILSFLCSWLCMVAEMSWGLECVLHGLTATQAPWGIETLPEPQFPTDAYAGYGCGQSRSMTRPPLLFPSLNHILPNSHYSLPLCQEAFPMPTFAAVATGVGPVHASLEEAPTAARKWDVGT